MEDNDYISESDSMSGSDSSEEMESQQYGGHYTKPGVKENPRRVVVKFKKGDKLKTPKEFQGQTFTRSKAVRLSPVPTRFVDENGAPRRKKVKAPKGMTAARNAVYLKNHPEAFGFRLAPFKKLMKEMLASSATKSNPELRNSTFSKDGVIIIKEYIEHVLGQICQTAHSIRSRTNPKRISINGDVTAAAHILGMPMSNVRFNVTRKNIISPLKFGGALRRIALRNDCLRMTKEARKALDDIFHGIMSEVMRNVGIAAENHLYTILDGKIVLRGKKTGNRKAHIRTQDIQTAIDTFREKRVLRV